MFTEDDKNKDRYYSDNNLWNPESKNVAILVYIYSMEFGNPALFNVLNLTMRTGDTAYFQSLGPYSVAMAVVTGGCEKRRDDKILAGKSIKEDKLNIKHFRACFNLFRGGAMKREWINDYVQHVQAGLWFLM